VLYRFIFASGLTEDGMSVKFHEENGCACVFFEGDIDLLNMTELKDVLLNFHANGMDIELDMAGVSYLDSSGIGMLLMIKKAQSSKGRLLVIKNIPDKLKKILPPTTIDSFLR